MTNQFKDFFGIQATKLYRNSNALNYPYSSSLCVGHPWILDGHDYFKISLASSFNGFIDIKSLCNNIWMM